MKYDLSHLTQEENQKVMGPIQDDEALLLYSLIKTMGLKKIVEVGSFHGYSATNFLKSIGEQGFLIGIDINPIVKIANNHTVIIKNIGLVSCDEIPWRIDLVFYDCHNFEESMIFHERMESCGKITKNTVLALHDTNLHPYKTLDHCYQIKDGWVHQACERKMVNTLHCQGWDAINFDTKMDDHGDHLPFRHGLTIMRRFSKLKL